MKKRLFFSRFTAVTGFNGVVTLIFDIGSDGPARGHVMTVKVRRLARVWRHAAGFSVYRREGRGKAKSGLGLAEAGSRRRAASV